MRSILLLLLGIAFAAPARADVPDSLGTIEGRILTQQGTPAAFFTVVALGTKRGGTADETGRFRLTRVPLGRQTLKVEGGRMTGPVARAIMVTPGLTRIENIIVTLAPAEIPEHLDIGSHAAASKLVAEVVSVKETYKYGDSPRFRVRIWNRGTNPVLLVKCVERSDRDRSPVGEWKIAAPFDGFVHVSRGVEKTSPRPTISSVDFVEVQPGEFFDPYMDGWVPNVLADGAVVRPGHYTATFRYATKARGPSAWFGSDASQVSAETLILLAHVPAVELTAKANFKVDF